MFVGMPPGAPAGAGAAAAAAVIANAIKASGAIVRMHSTEFQRLLYMMESPLVVCATGGLFWTTYKYLFGYKGMVFFTKASAPLQMPPAAEIVQADGIWVPN